MGRGAGVVSYVARGRCVVYGDFAGSHAQHTAYRGHARLCTYSDIREGLTQSSSMDINSITGTQNLFSLLHCVISDDLDIDKICRHELTR